MQLLLILVFCITSTIVKIGSSEIIYDIYNYDVKTAVTPLRYDIHLVLDNDPHDFKNYNGSVRIELISNIASNQLIFHYNQTDGRQIDFVKLFNLNKTSEIYDFRSTYFEYENNSYTALESDRSDFMEVNNFYSLFIVFRSNFIEGFNKGFFKNCHTINGGKRCYAATQFEITHIRETVPCFDEINFKTYFTVLLTHHRDLEAISNMPVEFIVPHEDESVTTIFQQTPLMSTYILAFAVGNFNKQNIISDNNVEINIYTSYGSGTLTPILVQHTAQILKLFENYLNMDYALPKLDFLIIDGYDIIGMENWGLIIVSDEEFIEDLSYPSLGNGEVSLNALAHELSHQFFGNLVTIKERKSLFLSEGFATYFASRMAHEINPAENYANRNMLEEQIKSFRYEKILSESVLNNFHPNDTIQETIIGYIKGSSFIRMINHLLGERSFRQMLVNYMDKYKYGSVTTNDLIDEIRIANGIDHRISDDIDIVEFVNSWINQDKFPIVTVTRNYDTGDVEIRQDRYQKQLSDPNYTWWIPINYATESHPDFNQTVTDFWLKNTRQLTKRLDLDPNEWLIINKDAAFYYIVLYDDKNLNLIGETLASESYNTIPAIDRAKLISDLGFLLAMGHQINTATVEKLLHVMCRDNSYITWNSFDLVLRYWRDDFNQELQNIFTQIQSKCSRHLYDHYPIRDSSPDDLRATQLIQVLAVRYACKDKYEKCLNDIDLKSIEYLHAMETNSSYYVTKELLSEIFEHGFRTNENLERIFNYIQSSSNEDLKRLFFFNFVYHSETPLSRKYFVTVIYNLISNETLHPLLIAQITRRNDKINNVSKFTQCLRESCYDFNQNYPNLTTRDELIRKILHDLITDAIQIQSMKDSLVTLLDTADQKYGNQITELIRNKYNLIK